MNTQDLDILILRYLNNEMTAQEKTAFELRMSNEESLKQAVKEYKDIQKAIRIHAKKQMKIDLQRVQNNIIKTKVIKKYKPSLNSGGTFSIGSFIIKTLILLAIASSILIYFNKMPIESLKIEKINKKLHSYDTIFEIKTDTIWQTIQSTKLKAGDTIYIKNQEELKKFKESLKEEY